MPSYSRRRNKPTKTCGCRDVIRTYLADGGEIVGVSERFPAPPFALGSAGVLTQTAADARRVTNRLASGELQKHLRGAGACNNIQYNVKTDIKKRILVLKVTRNFLLA